MTLINHIADYTAKFRAAAARVFLLFTISAAVLTLLTGCADRELDELAIITCMEVGFENGVYSIQAETAQLTDTESEPGQNTQIITSSGSSFSECVSALNDVESLHIYLGHLRLLILNKSFINSAGADGLKEIADFSVKNPEIRFNTELSASNESFGKAINAQSASTGNRGIDLSTRIRSLNTRSELCDLINYIDGFSAAPEIPVISVSKMNGTDTAVIRSSEKITLNIS